MEKFYMIIRLITTVLFFSIGLPAHGWAEPVTFRYKFSPGAKWTTTIGCKTTTNSAQDEAETVKGAGEFKLCFDNEVTQTGQDGAGVLRLLVQKLELINEIGAHRRTRLEAGPNEYWLNGVRIYDRKQMAHDPPPALVRMLRAPIELKISPRGQVTTVSVQSPAMADDQFQFDLQGQLSQEKLVFPQEPVEAGGSWTFSSQRSMWQGTWNLPTYSTLTFEGFQDFGGHKVARLVESTTGQATPADLNIKSTTKPEDGLLGGAVDVGKGPGETPVPPRIHAFHYQINGKIFFDLAAGQIVHLEQSGQVESDMSIMLPAGVKLSRIKQTQTFQVELETKLHAP